MFAKNNVPIIFENGTQFILVLCEFLNCFCEKFAKIQLICLKFYVGSVVLQFTTLAGKEPVRLPMEIYFPVDFCVFFSLYNFLSLFLIFFIFCSIEHSKNKKTGLLLLFQQLVALLWKKILFTKRNVIHFFYRVSSTL